jgi:hypothetical protein
MFFRYLYMNPCKEPTFCRPKISVNVSGYQLWNKFPSCWKTKWLRSGSVDITTGRPTKFVLNIGPYLECKMHYQKDNSNKKNAKMQLELTIFLTPQTQHKISGVELWGLTRLIKWVGSILTYIVLYCNWTRPKPDMRSRIVAPKCNILW